MRKSVPSVVAVGLIGVAAYLTSAAGPQAGSSDTFRQLKLFGDVFERVRAEYVEEINEDEVVFRNYEGKRFVYKQPRQAAGVGCDTGDVVPIRVASRSVKKPVRAKRRKTGS